MKKNLKLILLCASLGLALLALIMLALPGASASEGGVKLSIGLGGFMFGNHSMKSSYGGYSATVKATGGVSVFGLLGLILLIAAVVLVVLKIVLKKDKFELIAGILFAVAGVCMFMLLVAGTKATAYGESISFQEFVDSLDLGVGAILFGLFSIGAGACSIASKYVKNAE